MTDPPFKNSENMMFRMVRFDRESICRLNKLFTKYLWNVFDTTDLPVISNTFCVRVIHMCV